MTPEIPRISNLQRSISLAKNMLLRFALSNQNCKHSSKTKRDDRIRQIIGQRNDLWLLLDEIVIQDSRIKNHEEFRDVVRHLAIQRLDVLYTKNSNELFER